MNKMCIRDRVDTDVITSVTLRTDTDLTPDNPASVTFHIPVSYTHLDVYKRQLLGLL